jgi:alkylhydroperoxidase family enzyme
MARITLADAPGNEVARVWQTAPELGSSLRPLLAAMYDEDRLILLPRVREAARMRVALHNGCAVCRSHRLSGVAGEAVPEELYEHITEPDHPFFTQQESAAIRYADLFASDHRSIDDAVFVRLHEVFSDAEMAELTILLGVWLGLGRVVRTLDVENACSLDPELDGSYV